MLIKTKVLTHFVGDIGKGGQVFEPGEILEADPDLVWDYVRAGFMEYAEEFPKTKALKRPLNHGRRARFKGNRKGLVPRSSNPS